MKKLTALQQFVDKNGKTHQKNESFEVQNDQEAQELIRDGKAKESNEYSQSQSRNE